MSEAYRENPKTITSIGVAYRAHVSQATVSRVLNAKGNVRKETAEKVMAAVEELGYQPNAIARSLINRKTDIVALVSVNSTHSFYLNIINNISQILSRAGKHILYFQVKYDEDLKAILKQVHQYQVDGMIIQSAAVSPKVTEEAERINLPMAIFNRPICSDSIYSVCSDNVKASHMVADYLIEKGYTSFGFIGSTAMENISIDRQKGFTERLQERGGYKPLVEYGTFTYSSGWEAMRRMAEAKKLPEVIFSSNDLMAMGAMDFLRYELKLSLPEDIGIIGFDAIQEGAWQAYNLSSVEQPIAKMIETICDYLLKRMNDEPVIEKTHLFGCKILERETT
jgi:DNA-binding LacI/PurR family transcriptional regulator